MTDVTMLIKKDKCTDHGDCWAVTVDMESLVMAALMSEDAPEGKVVAVYDKKEGEE